MTCRMVAFWAVTAKPYFGPSLPLPPVLRQGHTVVPVGPGWSGVVVRPGPRQRVTGRRPTWIVTMPSVIGTHATCSRPASRMMPAMRSGVG